MIERILQHPIIPVVEIESAADAAHLAEAILAGGISIIEITLRTDAAIHAIRTIHKRFPEMLVGAGTIVTPEQAGHARDAGAHFGVAPGFNPEIVESFHEASLPFIPGVMTPTEIESAARTGCTLLKFFPARAAGGPEFLRALCGPYRHHGIHFCATGGVTPENMLDYLAIPLVNSIGGSWLATRDQIADKAWEVITQQVELARGKVASLGATE